MTTAPLADSVPSLPHYQFKNASVLAEALTHKSHVNERKGAAQTHNERLEFLGDAVLSLIISDHLAQRYTQLSEGALSKLKAHLVSEASLAQAARRMNLGAMLRLGRGEERSQGREKPSLLADALEAVIAAVYLDGGLEASRTFTLDVLQEELRQAEAHQSTPGEEDYKTRLQEWCQKRYDQLPQYAMVRESGPDHQKHFEVEVRVNEVVAGTGQGASKKEAEQMAAHHALDRIES
ncbi:MAG: ribonuclease III [Nitrospira sp.]|nr:ribonuclease III [Nitrospira sp.]